MLIYRAVNKLNGKSYIGKTEKSLEIRREWHLASVRQKSRFAFHRAISKYGVDAFEWQILATADNLQDLNNKEKECISFHESFGPKGYNMTAGGEGQSGWVPTAETRALWSKQRKGKPSARAGTAKPKKIKSVEEKAETQKLANKKRSEALRGRTPWNAGLKEQYGYTKYKVYYKDGTVKEGTRLDLDLPKSTIDTMFRDQCGSRKYNIEKIERL